MFAAILALAFTVFASAQEERHFDSEVVKYMDAVGLYFQFYKPELTGPKLVVTIEATEQSTVKLDALYKSKYPGIQFLQIGAGYAAWKITKTALGISTVRYRTGWALVKMPTARIVRRDNDRSHKPTPAADVTAHRSRI